MPPVKKNRDAKRKEPSIVRKSWERTSNKRSSNKINQDLPIKKILHHPFFLHELVRISKPIGIRPEVKKSRLELNKVNVEKKVQCITLPINPGIDLLKEMIRRWKRKKNEIDLFERFFKEHVRLTEEIKFPKNIEVDPSLKLTQYFLACMCRKYANRYWDLILQGRKVEELIGRKLVDNDVPVIFEFLSNNQEIQYVDLSHNKISSFGFILITNYLKNNSNVFGLNLMNNDINDMRHSTRSMFGRETNIRQLRLNKNPLKFQGRVNAVRLLKYNKLELLDVAETYQNLDSFAWLSEYARVCTSIKVLDVSRVLGRKNYQLLTYHLALLISDILSYNRSLVELHLQKNELNDHDIEQIAKGLVKHPLLKVLDLSCNSISNHGIEIFARILRNTVKLDSLLLSSNNIGDKGARALSLNLPFSKITVLNLSKNRIHDAGMIDLITCVKKPYPLKALYIFGNPFGTTTLRTLDDCFKHISLSPMCIDVRVTVLDSHYSVVYCPLPEVYKPRYYCQYETWPVKVIKWEGQSPMYYDMNEPVPLSTEIPNKKTVSADKVEK